MRMQLRGVTQLSYSWLARVGGQASKIRHALSPKFQHTISRSLHRRVRGEGCGRAGAKGVRARWARQDLLRQPLSASSSARGGLRLSGSQGCSCKMGPAKAFCSGSIAAFLARLMVRGAGNEEGAKGVRARWARQDLLRQPLSASSSARGGLRLSGSQGCSCKMGPAKTFFVSQAPVSWEVCRGCVCVWNQGVGNIGCPRAVIYG